MSVPSRALTVCDSVGAADWLRTVAMTGITDEKINTTIQLGYFIFSTSSYGVVMVEVKVGSPWEFVVRVMWMTVVRVLY